MLGFYETTLSEEGPYTTLFLGLQMVACLAVFVVHRKIGTHADKSRQLVRLVFQLGAVFIGSMLLNYFRLFPLMSLLERTREIVLEGKVNDEDIPLLLTHSGMSTVFSMFACVAASAYLYLLYLGLQECVLRLLVKTVEAEPSAEHDGDGWQRPLQLHETFVLLWVLAVLTPSLLRLTFTYLKKNHILIGYDHVTFFMAVFFPARAVYRHCRTSRMGYKCALLTYIAATALIIGGTVFCALASLYMAVANDVLFTYVFKTHELAVLRQADRTAGAGAIELYKANKLTLLVANHMVDRTFDTLDGENMDTVLEQVADIALSLKGMLVRHVEVLMFVATVLLPSLLLLVLLWLKSRAASLA